MGRSGSGGGDKESDAQRERERERERGGTTKTDWIRAKMNLQYRLGLVFLVQGAMQSSVGAEQEKAPGQGTRLCQGEAWPSDSTHRGA